MMFLARALLVVAVALISIADAVNCPQPDINGQATINYNNFQNAIVTLSHCNPTMPIHLAFWGPTSSVVMDVQNITLGSLRFWGPVTDVVVWLQWTRVNPSLPLVNNSLIQFVDTVNRATLQVRWCNLTINGAMDSWGRGASLLAVDGPRLTQILLNLSLTNVTLTGSGRSSLLVAPRSTNESNITVWLVQSMMMNSRSGSGITDHGRSSLATVNSSAAVTVGANWSYIWFDAPSSTANEFVLVNAEGCVSGNTTLWIADTRISVAASRLATLVINSRCSARGNKMDLSRSEVTLASWGMVAILHEPWPYLTFPSNDTLLSITETNVLLSSPTAFLLSNSSALWVYMWMKNAVIRSTSVPSLFDAAWAPTSSRPLWWNTMQRSTLKVELQSCTMQLGPSTTSGANTWQTPQLQSLSSQSTTGWYRSNPPFAPDANQLNNMPSVFLGDNGIYDPMTVDCQNTVWTLVLQSATRDRLYSLLSNNYGSYTNNFQNNGGSLDVSVWELNTADRVYWLNFTFATYSFSYDNGVSYRSGRLYVSLTSTNVYARNLDAFSVTDYGSVYFSGCYVSVQPGSRTLESVSLMPRVNAYGTSLTIYYSTILFTAGSPLALCTLATSGAYMYTYMYGSTVTFACTKTWMFPLTNNLIDYGQNVYLYMYDSKITVENGVGTLLTTSGPIPPPSRQMSSAYLRITMRGNSFRGIQYMLSTKNLMYTYTNIGIETTQFLSSSTSASNTPFMDFLNVSTQGTTQKANFLFTNVTNFASFARFSNTTSTLDLQARNSRIEISTQPLRSFRYLVELQAGSTLNVLNVSGSTLTAYGSNTVPLVLVNLQDNLMRTLKFPVNISILNTSSSVTSVTLTRTPSAWNTWTYGYPVTAEVGCVSQGTALTGPTGPISISSSTASSCCVFNRCVSSQVCYSSGSRPSSTANAVVVLFGYFWQLSVFSRKTQFSVDLGNALGLGYAPTLSDITSTSVAVTLANFYDADVVSRAANSSQLWTNFNVTYGSAPVSLAEYRASRSNGGDIAGGVIGAILFVGLVIVVIVYLKRRQAQQQALSHHQQQQQQQLAVPMAVGYEMKPVVYGSPQPPPTAYAPPPQPGYNNAPPPGAYGAPPPAGYGAPPPAGYGAPPPAGYGAPPPASYGSPPAPAGYGAPPAQGYGSPPPPPLQQSEAQWGHEDVAL